MKWLVKAAFLTSAMMIIPTTLSAQNPLPDYIVGIAKEQGSQGQKITTLEETARETKREIHEFKRDVDTRFDKLEQMIANSTAEANARFEQFLNETRQYMQKTEKRLENLEQPWSSNAFVSVVTDPLTSFSMFLAVGGTLLARGEYKQLSYLTLGLSTACLAQVLWDAFVLPVKYAVVSGISFMSVSGAGIYALNEYKNEVGTLATKASTGAGLVVVLGFLYRVVDTWSAAEKRKTEL